MALCVLRGNRDNDTDKGVGKDKKGKEWETEGSKRKSR